jgi:hypothetical protein
MRNAALVVLALTFVAVGTNALTGQTRASAGSVSCTPYEAASLRLTASTNSTWLLERNDGARIRAFANRADADAGLAVFKQHREWCLIGRGNTFPEPSHSEYIMEFLR